MSSRGIKTILLGILFVLVGGISAIDSTSSLPFGGEYLLVLLGFILGISGYFQQD